MIPTHRWRCPANFRHATIPLPLIAVCTAALLTLTACGKGEAKIESLSAKQVCDSSLDDRASTALEYVTGTKDFAEVGERSVKDAAQKLANQPREREDVLYSRASLCTITAASDNSDSMDFDSAEILFTWFYSKARMGYAGDPGEFTYYRTAEMAQSSDKSGKAFLYFKCNKPGGTDAGTGLIEARLLNEFGDGTQNSRRFRDSQIIILNSASRKLAAELKCAHSNLSKVLDLRTVSPDKLGL